MTEWYFVWVEGLRGPVPQKWSSDGLWGQVGRQDVIVRFTLDRCGSASAARRTGEAASDSRREIAGRAAGRRVPQGSARQSQDFEHGFLRNIANLISLPG